MINAGTSRLDNRRFVGAWLVSKRFQEIGDFMSCMMGALCSCVTSVMS